MSTYPQEDPLGLLVSRGRRDGFDRALLYGDNPNIWVDTFRGRRIDDLTAFWWARSTTFHEGWAAIHYAMDLRDPPRWRPTRWAYPPAVADADPDFQGHFDRLFPGVTALDFLVHEEVTTERGILINCPQDLSWSMFDPAKEVKP